MGPRGGGEAEGKRGGGTWTLINSGDFASSSIYFSSPRLAEIAPTDPEGAAGEREKRRAARRGF